MDQTFFPLLLAPLGSGCIPTQPPPSSTLIPRTQAICFPPFGRPLLFLRIPTFRTNRLHALCSFSCVKLDPSEVFRGPLQPSFASRCARITPELSPGSPRAIETSFPHNARLSDFSLPFSLSFFDPLLLDLLVKESPIPQLDLGGSTLRLRRHTVFCNARCGHALPPE